MTDHKLLTAERERKIVELLKRSTFMPVASLCNEIGVSEATIRRDLQGMHERGLLKRVRGGATIAGNVQREERIFSDKEAQFSKEKKAIAKLALDQIHEHDTIFLDGGSTILFLARLLASRKNLTIVTNSLMAAAELMETSHRLILVGGEFRALSRTLVGPLTAPIIQGLNVDKAFMGTIGFTIKDGMTTTDPGEAFTKEQILKRSNQVILMADSSKIGIPSFARSGSLDDIDILITDKITKNMRNDLESHGIQVVVSEN